ncbi:aminoglycoside phosphotransferase family protein [Arthrobacter sp. 754]|uniref:aminoglycoside phosphotransferase family protein n=1 Tax=Arthrobacter sp. 754 TaxID=3156315 RepID=UPI0033940A12
MALITPKNAQRPRLVVKVPRQPGDNGGVRREAAMLQQLWAMSPDRAEATPAIVGVFDIGNHCVLVETAMTGRPLDPALVTLNLPGAVRSGVEFVAGLPSTERASTNGDWYTRKLSQPLSELSELVTGHSEVVSLVERTHERLEVLRTAELPAVFEHADLSHPNILVRPGGTLQVVDWERSSSDGLPGHDLVFYLQYLNESVRRAFSRTEQVAAFTDAFSPGGWARGPLRKHLEARDVDPGLLSSLIVATWARSAATLGERLAGERSSGQQRHLVREAVLADRDFWLWRHAIETAGQC